METDHPTTSPQTGRQTLSYLRGMFDQHGIRPNNKLGQNFLIDLNVLELLVRAVELQPNDIIVEIGSGTGGLTERLAAEAAAVLSVEVDPAFHSLAAELLSERDNVELLHADVLKNKNHFNPEVLAALDEMREQHPGKTLKLAANLPYVVATPVIANFLITGLPFERMVVTVQWEIAERLLAEPANKEFNSLTVLVQSLADVELVRRLPPSVFWPRPQVHSAIVCIRPNADKRGGVGDVLRFRHFLRDLYSHRRKNLRTALKSMPGSGLSKQEVDQELLTLGIEGTVRAETLSINDHLRLCRVFSNR